MTNEEKAQKSIELLKDIVLDLTRHPVSDGGMASCLKMKDFLRGQKDAINLISLITLSLEKEEKIERTDKTIEPPVWKRVS